MLKIRIPNSTWSSQKVVLDNVTLNLELHYNTRGNNWYISIYDEDNVAILEGIKIVPNYPVFNQYLDDRLPSGNIYCVRVNPRELTITKDNLGTDYLLVYLTQQEELDAVTV